MNIRLQMASLYFVRSASNTRLEFPSHIRLSYTLFFLTLLLSSYALAQNVQSAITYSYDDYMKACIDPVEPNKFEYLFDYVNRSDVLTEYSAFDSKKLMENLSKTAADLSIPPYQFNFEMEKMLFHMDDASFDPFKLTSLEEKYKISLQVEGPESITRARLRLMFPHFARIEQKPFQEYDWKKFSPNSNKTIPALFRHEDFGGLIPRAAALDKSARRVIIAVHLYSLMNRVEEKSGRYLCRLLKERIDKSLLSDGRRIFVLQNNDVLTKKKEVRREIWKAFDEVPDNFVDDICWDILS